MTPPVTPAAPTADPLAALLEMVAALDAHGVRRVAGIQIHTAAGWRPLMSNKGGECE